MAEYEKKVRDMLKQNGCSFVWHGKGDHDIWYSPITKKNVTVDTTIKLRHTANAIMKQSGIDYHFLRNRVRTQAENFVCVFCKKIKNQVLFDDSFMI